MVLLGRLAATLCRGFCSGNNGRARLDGNREMMTSTSCKVDWSFFILPQDSVSQVRAANIWTFASWPSIPCPPHRYQVLIYLLRWSCLRRPLCCTSASQSSVPCPLQHYQVLPYLLSRYSSVFAAKGPREISCWHCLENSGYLRRWLDSWYINHVIDSKWNLTLLEV